MFAKKHLAIIVIILTLLGIGLYVGFVFRKSSPAQKLYKEAITHYEAKEYDEAILDYIKIITDYPNFPKEDPSIYYNFGLTYIYKDKLFSAGRYFYEFLQLENLTEQITPQMHFIMATTFADTENYYLALQELNKVTPQDFGEEIEENKYIGYLSQTYLSNNQSDKALFLADQLISKQGTGPSSLKPLAIKTYALTTKGEKEEAVKTWQLLFKAFKDCGDCPYFDLFTREIFFTFLYDIIDEAGKFESLASSLSEGINNTTSNFSKATIYNDLGQFYRQKKDINKAIEFFEKAVETEPDYMRAFLNLGNLYTDQKSFDKALDLYQKTIEIDPNHPMATYAVGWANYKLGKYDLVIPFLEKSIKVDPEYAFSENLLGTTYDKIEKLEKALEHYKRAIEIDPSYKKPYLNLSAIYIKRNEFDKAIEWLQKSLDLDPNYALAHNNLGVIYHRQGLYEKALKELLLANKLNSNFAETYFRVAETYVRLGNPSEAKKYLAIGKKLDPDFNHSCIEAEIYEAEGKQKEAAEAKQKCFASDSKREAVLFYNQGLDYKSKGQLPEAVESLTKAIRTDDSFISAYVMLGQTYLSLRQYEKAIEILEKALTIDPGKVNTLLTLGSVYHEQGDYVKAVSSYKKAIEIDSSSDIAWDNLGLVYYDSKNFQEAKTAFEKSLEIDRKNINHWINLGQTLIALGKIDEAIKIMQDAVNIQPKNALLHNNLGNAYALKDQISDAIAEFKVALLIDPNLRIAQENLKKYQDQ